MKTPYSIAQLVATTLLWLLASSTNFACDRQLPQAIHPREIVSESGEYSLKLDPSDLHGRDHGTYSLSQNNRLLWSKQFEFTLLELAVTNTGSIVGFGYTHGIEGFGKEVGSGDGDFVVAIIDSAGKAILVDKHEREGSRWFHTDPDPKASGFVVDEANDRIMVRIDDPDPNVRDEKWWQFKISTGGTLPDASPKLKSQFSGYRSPLHVRALRGTNLYLVQWWLVAETDSALGTMFSLHDDDGLEVWSLSLPKDYEVPKKEDQDSVRKHIWNVGAILSNSQPNRFSLHFYMDNAIVDFHAMQNKKGAWNVQETSRKPFAHSESKLQQNEINDEVRKPKKLNVAFESIELKPLKAKQSVPIPVNPIRNIQSGFDLDSGGNIGFLRTDKGETTTFVLVDNLGKELASIPIGIDLKAETAWSGVAYVGGNQFVVIRSETGNAGTASAFKIDSQEKRVTPLPDFQSPAVRCFAGFGDGGFAVLACEHSESTRENSVSKHDSSGRRLWTILESFEDFPKTLFSPESLTVSDTSEVLVLGNVSDEVQVFNPDGTLNRVIELEEKWGRKPSYPTDIASAPDQEILVFDFQGSPSMVLMQADGTPKDSFDARLAVDRAPLAPVGQPKIDGQGRIWITDGDTFMRLGEEGIVDRILGEAVDNQTLGEIGAVAWDREGNIFAQSRKSRVIHQFDRNGEFIRTFSDDALRDSGWASDPIHIARNGDVYVNAGNTYEDKSAVVHFSKDGRSLEKIQLDFPNIQPFGDTGKFLSKGYDLVSIVDRTGELVRSIQRQPDRNWLEHIDSIKVSSGGEFAVQSNHRNSIPKLPDSINIYSATGEPIRTLTIPNLPNFGKFDFDGSSLVVCSPDEIVVYDAFGNAKYAMDYPGKKKGGYWMVTLTNKGTELMLVDANAFSAIYRVKLPTD